MLKTLRQLQPILACIVAIISGCIAPAARAQTASIAATSLGKVMAATSGVTTFRFAAADGSVSVYSGGGSRISTGAVRFAVNVPCSGKQCASADTIVVVGSVGSPTGRAGSLTNFTVSMGTAKLVSGPTGTNPVTFTIGAIGLNNTATFYIGADMPISGDDSGKSTGAASASMYVETMSSSGKNAITSQGSATATVDRSLSITQNTALTFGRIALPPSGTATVTMPATTGMLTISGNAIAINSPSPARGNFTISGEGGQTISVSVTNPTLTNGGSGSLAVTTSNTAQGTQILSGSLGAAGTFSFYVGGSFTLSSTTPIGSYSGSYLVSVNYN